MWIPKDSPYDIRKPDECTTFELTAFIGYAKQKLEREPELEQQRREWLENWLRELEAEREDRRQKAAEHARRMKASHGR